MPLIILSIGPMGNDGGRSVGAEIKQNEEQRVNLGKCNARGAWEERGAR